MRFEIVPFPLLVFVLFGDLYMVEISELPKLYVCVRDLTESMCFPWWGSGWFGGCS